MCRDIEHEYDLAASRRSMTISGSLLAWRLCLTELDVHVCIEWYVDVPSCAMRIPPFPLWLQRPPFALNPNVPLFDVSSRVFTIRLRCRCDDYHLLGHDVKPGISECNLKVNKSSSICKSPEDGESDV